MTEINIKQISDIIPINLGHHRLSHYNDSCGASCCHKCNLCIKKCAKHQFTFVGYYSGS